MIFHHICCVQRAELRRVAKQIDAPEHVKLEWLKEAISAHLWAKTEDWPWLWPVFNLFWVGYVYIIAYI